MTYRPDLLSPADRTALQTELAKAGYYHGEIDGIWGAKSTAAFASWQLAQSPGGVSDETDLTDATRAEFSAMWVPATIQPEHVDEVNIVARRLVSGRDRYQAVSASTGVPWHVIGLIFFLFFVFL